MMRLEAMATLAGGIAHDFNNALAVVTCNLEFVEAAVAMGANKRRILFTEILPNLWAPILVYATLTLPAYIGLEAALSFLGVGVLPPETTFGAMLANSVNYFNVVPTYLFIPGTVLVVLVVSFNIFGDALRDALDPKAVR